MVAVILDIAVTLGFATTGYLCARLLLKEASWLDILSLAFPLGSGLMTWFFFLFGWIGISFDRLQVIVIWLGVNLVFAVLIWSKHNNFAIRKPAVIQRRPSLAGPDFVALSILGASLIISIILSIGRSYSVYDAIAMWAPKGYGIALERSLWGAHWGNHGFAYPLNIQFIIASFRLFSGDILPGSKITFPLFFFSMLLGIYSFWVKKRVNSFVRAISILVLATVPTLFSFSMIGYANLPMATCLVLAILWGIEGMEERDSSRQVLSGILLGITVWTIIEGMLYVAVVIPVMFIARYVSRAGQVKPIAWIAPVVVIGGAWFVFYRLHGSAGSQAMSAASKMWQAFLQGNFRLPELRMILGYARRNIFEISTWGFIYPFGILFSILGWKKLRPGNDFVAFALLISTAATAVLSLGLFYLRSFDIPGFYYLLQRGFHRGFMSPTILLFILGIQLLTSFQIRHEDKGI